MHFIPQLLSAPLTTVSLQMNVTVVKIDANTLLIKTAAAAAKAFHNLIIYRGKNICIKCPWSTNKNKSNVKSKNKK